MQTFCIVNLNFGRVEGSANMMKKNSNNNNDNRRNCSIDAICRLFDDFVRILFFEFLYRFCILHGGFDDLHGQFDFNLPFRYRSLLFVLFLVLFVLCVELEFNLCH